MHLGDFRTVFDPLFLSHLDKSIARACTVTSSKKTHAIVGHIRRVAENGKRIRPYIAYLAYGSSKLDRQIINQLIAIELVHLMAIIHDDIIDKSPSRHGTRTLHSLEKDEHYGNSYALLAGDLVLNWAHEAFIKQNKEAESHSIFCKLVEQVAIGEMMDVEMSTRTNWTKTEIDEKTILKSARYTFTHPAEIGLSLRRVKVSKKLQKTYSTLNENMGVLFQIDDDLLDIFGDEKKLNKKTFQDIETRQATLVSFYLIKNKAFKKYFGKVLNQTERDTLRSLVTTSGTLEKINSERDMLIADTQKLLRKIPDAETWHALLLKITKRDR